MSKSGGQHHISVPWGWLPFTGTVCAIFGGLFGMLATMMTQDIWSAHTSMRGQEVVEQLAAQITGGYQQANISFIRMEAACREALEKLAAPPRHWWQR